MTDPVLIVTGAGRGIGAACARLGAAYGYAVCVNYLRNQAAAESLVHEIHAAGGRAFAVQADVSREEDVRRLFTTVDRKFGLVTALVNNAGILERQSRLDEMDGARWQRILGTNVIGCFLCCKEAVRRMSFRHGGAGGAIVNISSVAARLGAPNEYIDYAASKGAIDSLTLGLSKEVAAEGIRVNAVRPGIIETDIHASGGEPGRVERLKDSLPIKRGGRPDEVAHAVLWLLSGEASYATGSFIDLAGGR